MELTKSNQIFEYNCKANVKFQILAFVVTASLGQGHFFDFEVTLQVKQVLRSFAQVLQTCIRKVALQVYSIYKIHVL
jgi:hypothetical protein